MCRTGRQRNRSIEAVYEEKQGLEAEQLSSAEVHARLQHVMELNSSPRLGSPRSRPQQDTGLAVISGDLLTGA